MVHNVCFYLVLKFDSLESPRLVHRLDKDTTGILILARTRSSAVQMFRRFSDHSLEKKVRYVERAFSIY